MSPLKMTLPALATAALALAACSAETEETTYEVDAEDVGGGELQVADPQPGEVPVDLPETPMKNVDPASEGDEMGEGDAGQPVEQ